MSEEIKDDIVEITPTEATEVEVQEVEPVDNTIEEVVEIGVEEPEYIPNINDFIPYGDIIPEGIE